VSKAQATPQSNVIDRGAAGSRSATPGVHQRHKLPAGGECAQFKQCWRKTERGTNRRRRTRTADAEPEPPTPTAEVGSRTAEVEGEPATAEADRRSWTSEDAQ